ncbi:MAG: DUF86 domain-containing protein [Chrysiogenetes bacterium]|nr:DUF86 domain-containing protein [Chrysiogenetes bacterium]
MRDHAREAIEFTKGKTLPEVQSDRMLSLALTRLLEIVGEAATRIPEEMRAKYPGIPWPQIVGLRNRLIHGYDSIDYEILWEILHVDLPPLISQLEEILTSLKSE